MTPATLHAINELHRQADRARAKAFNLFDQEPTVVRYWLGRAAEADRKADRLKGKVQL
jgi:hypothetical protein